MQNYVTVKQNHFIVMLHQVSQTFVSPYKITGAVQGNVCVEERF